MVKKVLLWGTVSFLIFFVAYRPSAAAQVFAQIGGGIWNIVEGFGNFFKSLVS